VGVACLALVGAAFGVASADRIGNFVDNQYTAFVTLGGAQGEPTASRLETGAGNRYDYWRIAVDAWQAHPIAGVGAGGYEWSMAGLLTRFKQRLRRVAGTLPARR